MKYDERILVVDDNSDTVELLRRNLTAQGYRVHSAGNVPEAVELLARIEVDLVITDIKMPRISGIDLIRHVRENVHDCEVMVLTGYPSVENAVQAVKLGAVEYLSKPFTAGELNQAVRRILDSLEMRRSLIRQLDSEENSCMGLVGRSPAMQQVFSVIRKAAASHATVLIHGDSGTGKELVARAIHYQSRRAAAPFVPVNCGGIPESLLESELFGHVKGAFTGAIETRAGFFMTADGGTLFLDEISETSAAMQVKLLRVLQEQEVCMVGAARPRRVDVRIVAASNRDLAKMVELGTFRQDLYYRINVIELSLPPLRQRGNDVLLLVQHFARRYAKEYQQAEKTFTDKALRAFADYDWPGNVRELENVVLRCMVMSDNPTIDVVDLPDWMRFSAAKSSSHAELMSLAELEARHIRQVMAALNGNKSQAAAVLGIDRKTLREKLKRHH